MKPAIPDSHHERPVRSALRRSTKQNNKTLRNRHARQVIIWSLLKNGATLVIHIMKRPFANATTHPAADADRAAFALFPVCLFYMSQFTLHPLTPLTPARSANSFNSFSPSEISLLSSGGQTPPLHAPSYFPLTTRAGRPRPYTRAPLYLLLSTYYFFNIFFNSCAKR
jgi:hypothetical protein